MTHSYKRAGRLLVGLMGIMGVLVFTHLGDVYPAERNHELGEFWPFSIYPMFSQGGNPWKRSLVRELPDADAPDRWQPRTFDTLPGTPYALNDVGILQNDIANFISKTKVWNARRVAGMRRTFGDELDTKYLMIYRAQGRIDADSVAVVFTPFLLLAPDSTYFNPNLSYRFE